MRSTFLPFALPGTDETEIDEIAEAVRSGWVTTGPKTSSLRLSRSKMLRQQDFGGLLRAPLPVKTGTIKAILLPMLLSETSKVWNLDLLSLNLKPVWGQVHRRR
jgi:hypothetical protein